MWCEEPHRRLPAWVASCTPLIYRSGVSRCPASPSMQRRIMCLSCCWIHSPCEEECTCYVVLNIARPKEKENKPYKNNCMTHLNLPKQGNSKLRPNIQDHTAFWAASMWVLPTRILSSPGVCLACHFDTQQLSHYSGRNDPHSLRLSSLFSLLGLVFRRIFIKQLQTGGFVYFNFESWSSLLKVVALQKKDQNWFQ